MDDKRFTVRAGSPLHASGGSTHSVKGGYVHMMFDPNNGDYDVAVVRVRTDFDIPTDSANYVTCLEAKLFYL
jgi:hypothetical protein